MPRFLTHAAAVALALLVVQPAAASPEIREKFDELAQLIVKAARGQTVSVGVFSQTGLPESNAGPGLEAILTEALNRQQPGIVRSEAPLEIKGDYAYARLRESTEPDLKVIKINVRIIDKEFGEDLLQVPLQIALDHTRTVAQLLQVTAALPPEGSKAERNQELDQQRRHPAVHIHGAQATLVSSTPQSPYAVEILARPLESQQTAEPRPARVDDGLAFVDIGLGELYEVKFYNRSDREAAVALSIDGLDLFHFSKDRAQDGRPKFTHIVIGPKSSATVVGWHNALAGTENYLSFLVTAYGQGAVSKAGIKARGQVGVIHAQFSHCFPLPQGATPRGGNETGFGPPRNVQQTPVRREIEPPHDFVTIRYTRPQQ